MDPNCCVTGCVSAPKHPHFNQYYECTVNRLDPRGVAAARLIAQTNGHKLAAQLQVGQFVAAQAREDEDDTYIIGVATDCGD